MKNTNMMAILAVGVLGANLGATSVANASVSRLAGTWSGTGTTYSLDGDVRGSYGVQLVDSVESDGSVASAVTVSIPGQADLQYEYLFEDTAKGFTMVSEQGSGGALCLEHALCEGYFGDAQGNGVAMTIINDSADSFRSLKTELKGFRATSISLESYVRVSR